MSERYTRRQAFGLFAAAATLPLGELLAGRAVPRHTWRGTVLGGTANITMAAGTKSQARRMVTLALDEIERLERALSLYRADSALVELNRRGRLERAPGDLRVVVAAATRMAQLSDGAFDATVQPLWRARVDGDRGDSARSLVDGAAVACEGATITLPRPGMALTLNGIAQGYIADRIATLLAAEGFRHILLELGEIRALGPAEHGRPWRLALPGTRRTIELAEGACATSLGRPPGMATAHILDPRTGEFAAAQARATVLHRSAMWADALSTALCVAGPGAAPALLAATGGGRAIVAAAGSHEVEVVV